MSALFLLLLKKEIYFKRKEFAPFLKELAPRGSKLFRFRVNLFKKGIDVKVGKQVQEYSSVFHFYNIIQH